MENDESMLYHHRAKILVLDFRITSEADGVGVDIVFFGQNSLLSKKAAVTPMMGALIASQ